MKRIRKIVLWSFGIGFVAVGLGWIALSLYINGSLGRRSAAEQLGQLVGLKVEVDHFNVGTTSTTIGLRIPDPSADSPGDLIRIGSLRANVSLFELLAGGAAPTSVTVKDVEILLRFDAGGKLQTPFPKSSDSAGTPALPEIEFERVRLHIHRTGHPEFDFGTIAGRLGREGDHLVLAGNADEPKWGQWRIDGRFHPTTFDGQLRLHSDSAPLDDPLLRSVPFVPSELWDQLAPSGRTTATVTLSYRPGRDLGYRVELRPAKAALRFPTADTTVEDVTGTIIIEDGRVTVADGHVQLAAGSITVEGDYRFDQPERIIALKLRAEGVDVRRLPATWGLPPEIEGRLRGKADLQFHIGTDGQWTPRGGGTGDVVGAKFAGLDATIRLKLGDRQGRLRFESIPE